MQYQKTDISTSIQKKLIYHYIETQPAKKIQTIIPISVYIHKIHFTNNFSPNTVLLQSLQ